MISRSRLIVFSLILAASAAAAASQTVPTAAGGQTATNSIVASSRPDDRYRIGFRDTLNVQVFRHPDLNQTVTVNPNGTIILFKINEPIVAACKTERELARDIADAYRKDYLKNPEVNVVATEQRSQAFAVMGAVEKPANYFINRRVQLLELLAFAGGPTKDAGSRVVVARTGSTSNCDPAPATATDDIKLFNFKVNDVLEGKQTLLMQPGDMVSVMPADLVFVYGNVNEQGQVVMRQPLTLTQAIASAKGLKPATKKDSVRIIRQKPGTLEQEVFPFDLNDIDKQKVADPYLQPNDIVAVSEDRTKSILNSIKNSLTQGLPSVFYRVP